MGSYKSSQAPGNGATDQHQRIELKQTGPHSTKMKSKFDSSNQKNNTTAMTMNPPPNASVSTYASTTRSTAELQEEAEQQQQQQIKTEEQLYEVDDRQENFPTDALASTPSSFAGLFPSSRRLLIRHDDATIDGNMNLRVDTVVPCRAGYQQDVILFHLRMYDLFSRKFSFRRYCRDSGREVCHSARKEAVSHHADHQRRRRSLSSVLASLRPGSSSNGGHHSANSPQDLKRQDSGYEAGMDSFDLDDPGYDHGVENGHGHGRGGQPPLTETILLEFSNYAHVELRRRGTGATKKYEYEYWSTKYQWRREYRREGDLREVSYYLVDMRSSKTIAHMVPEIMTPLEAVEEESKGGWVPPCSMWINDSSIYERMPDVADVIVATGLVALVDDCIRRRWHQEHRPTWSLPRTLLD
ncbi:hypothetical protein N7481_013138 [Penicillium waksmanii]|uniref:uncharacterized protein n=1 Tax=Penicillium waksmanii TaxID=69791 RepID=UPI002548E160|nr:uncharacterized protein N7481_013138 [Penicillium waksmanii]KAJ5966424.1 hypothetical protein N7481_013138 [Penicillium waksmanii]